MFVDSHGNRYDDLLIQWMGKPKRVAVDYPYLFGFDSSFIEVHDIVSGDLKQLIPCIASQVSDKDICTVVNGHTTQVQRLTALGNCFLH
jgi:hypothetical protein